MTKAELRKTCLARQRQLTDAERLEKSRRITAHLFQTFDFTGVDFLHCFLPIEKNREVDTRQIFDEIWQSFPRLTTVVSRVNFELMTLEHIAFSSETKLVFNRWHILEPADGKPLDEKKIDAVLIPLLAFDKRGFRVGYGRGFYDKFLSVCRDDVLKIGLSYFPPRQEISDIRDFDIALDFCVTPIGVNSFKKTELPKIERGC